MLRKAFNAVATGLEANAIVRLTPWKGAVVLWVKGDWPDLTNRQLALLMIICLEPGRHFVRHLAERLEVPKPIISRVIDRLFELDMLTREIDRRDRRNVFAVPTSRAFEFCNALDTFLQAA